MSIESTSTATRLEEFESYLRTARYAAAIQRGYLWIAQRFLDYLRRKCIAVEAAHATASTIHNRRYVIGPPAVLIRLPLAVDPTPPRARGRARPGPGGCPLAPARA